MRFKDQVILVTGASKGIGRAIALTLGKEGGIIGINYNKSQAMAEEAVREIESAGGKAIALQGDVRKADEAERVVDTLVEKFDRINVLVNNAGIIRDMLLFSMADEDWNEVIDTNLGGTVNFTRAVIRIMMLQKRGKIINISSVAAERFGKGQSNYAASKAAVNAFTKVMALELGSKGITVNGVAPGMVDTEMIANVRNLAGEGIMAKIPMGRYATPDDVARVVAFLASSDADYITGEVITVDGGLTLGVGIARAELVSSR